MKRLQKFLGLLGLLGLALNASSRPAQAQSGLRIVGALSNFDCYNDTSDDCSGFEIELEGIHKEQVVHTWNYSAYGAPTVTDGGTPTAPSAIVRYHSSSAVVHSGGVTHFGVTLAYYTQPGTILRRWLPKATPNVPNPPPVPYILPSHQTQLTVTNGIEEVHNSITNDTPDGHTILWVLPYGNRVHGRHVELEELMPTNPVVTNAVPMGSGSNHTRPSKLLPGETWASDDPPDQEDSASDILWYEVYADVATPRGGGRFDHAPGQLIGRVMDATITSLPAPVPTEVLLSDTAVFGTQDVIGRVTIGSGSIPAGGVVVQLASNNPAATVPTTVTVPANQVSALFTIHTGTVAALTNVTITASTGGSSLNAQFSVKPPDLNQLWLSYISIGGGRNVDGLVYLTSPAPDGGVTVQLTSNSDVAQIPATVTVPAGATTVPLTVTTRPVAAPITVTFTATYNGITKTTTLRVAPDIFPISGVINLQGIDPAAPMQTVTLTFRPTDGSAAVTRTVPARTNTAFSFSDIPAKNYTLHISAGTYLGLNLAVNAANSEVSGLNALLKAGDANGDNSVDALDLAVLISAFNTAAGDPDWDAAADLNFDGSADALDLALLITNFNQDGDQ